MHVGVESSIYRSGNANVNVAEKIVNGTKGVMKSLLWIDKSVQRRMERLIIEEIKCGNKEVF